MGLSLDLWYTTESDPQPQHSDGVTPHHCSDDSVGHERHVGVSGPPTRVQAKGGMHRFGHAAGPVKRLENEYELGEEIRHGKFGSVHAYRAWASNEEFT
jgi:hypothetical protein